MMKCLKQISLVLLFFLVFLLGCSQNQNSVSIEEYNKVLEERDYYKTQYEILLEASKTEINELNTEELIRIVDFSSENILDYFEFYSIYVEDKISNITYNNYVIKSKIFDDGWIYYDTSKDFEIVFDNTIYGGDDIYPKGYSSIKDIEELDGVPFETDSDKPSIVSVNGKMRFINKKAVDDYSLDDYTLRRTIVLSDILREKIGYSGLRKSKSIKKEQTKYNY